MTTSSFFARAAVLAGAVLFLTQCSTKPKDLKGSCRDRFDKLHGKYELGRYAYAKEGYDDFVVTCAGTEHAEQAHYELASSHFMLKEWLDAEEEYSAFLKDYPNSRDYGEIARWRLALSMGREVQIPQRDQSKTLDAIREFETFEAEFSGSSRIDSANAELDRLHNLLAERDQLIARLYSRMDEPLAAVIYYKHILAEYGDRVPRREINLKMAECYIDLGQFIEAENILIQFDGVAKDDPFAAKIKKARARLEKAKAKYEKEKKAEKKAAAPSGDEPAPNP